MSGVGKRVRSGRLAAIALGLALIACSPGTRTATGTIEPFLAAVQAQDLDRLYCLFAGVPQAEELGRDDAERRASFRAWADSYYELYLAGRDEGFIDLDDNGILVVKLFALGKGTFYTYSEPRQLAPDAMRIRTRLRFGYRQLDLSRLSAGTTFYVAGAPAGRVHPVRVPSRSAEVSLDVLDTLALEWTLKRNAPSDGCAGGWAVVSVTPVEGSATESAITWVF